MTSSEIKYNENTTCYMAILTCRKYPLWRILHFVSPPVCAILEERVVSWFSIPLFFLNSQNLS